MDILSFNFKWMLWNSVLAFLPVVFAFSYAKANNRIAKYASAILWFLFVPNTIYVFSDMQHLIEQWFRVTADQRLLLISEYIILESIGLVSFLIAMAFFEKELRRKFHKKNQVFITRTLVIFNFMIGFAMVLGKIERVNSWDVFYAPHFVLSSINHVVSDFGLLALAILFGLFGNCFYFLFRNRFVLSTKNSYHAHRR